jgi:pimeloyl-ACP methyl ester carboxylesterase
VARRGTEANWTIQTNASLGTYLYGIGHSAEQFKEDFARTAEQIIESARRQGVACKGEDTMPMKLGWWLDMPCKLPLTEARQTLDGVELYYRTGGSGPHLLLLHGFTQSGRKWDPFLDELGKHYTVIVPDLPGHGRSSAFRGLFTFRDTARLMFALCDGLGVERVRGIGHSAGATILMLMGVQKPERVEAVVLVGGPHRSTPQALEQVRNVSWESRGEEHHELWKRQHPGGEPQIRAILAQFRKQADDTADWHLSPEHLATIQARTLVVLGDRDWAFPVEFAVEMYRAIPDAALWIVPGQGHGAGMGESPETFLQVVTDYLAQGVPS